MIGDERQIRKTPRWWAVAPPTPAEAPQAKRRTAARSRGSIVLLLAVVAAFVVSVLLLLFRVGRQVGGVEPVVASLVGSVPIGPSTLPRPAATLDAGANAMIELADAAAATSGDSGTTVGRRRPAREVFRKPGF